MAQQDEHRQADLQAKLVEKEQLIAAKMLLRQKDNAKRLAVLKEAATLEQQVKQQLKQVALTGLQGGLPPRLTSPASFYSYAGINSTGNSSPSGRSVRSKQTAGRRSKQSNSNTNF